MFKQISAPGPSPSAPSPTASQMPELASDLARQAYATRKAGHLLNLYRKGDAQDPETYVAGLAAVLSEYDPAVVDYVCDPRTGIARRLKWLPTIAEIADECDIRAAIQKNVDALRAMAAQKRATIADPNAADAAKITAQRWLDHTRNSLEQIGVAPK